MTLLEAAIVAVVLLASTSIAYDFGRPHASPAICLPAVATGVTLGLGLGFRVDMAIIVPAVVAVIVFGLRGLTRAAVASA